MKDRNRDCDWWMSQKTQVNVLMRYRNSRSARGRTLLEKYVKGIKVIRQFTMFGQDCNHV